MTTHGFCFSALLVHGRPRQRIHSPHPHPSNQNHESKSAPPRLHHASSGRLLPQRRRRHHRTQLRELPAAGNLPLRPDGTVEGRSGTAHEWPRPHQDLSGRHTARREIADGGSSVRNAVINEEADGEISFGNFKEPKEVKINSNLIEQNKDK